MNYRCHTCGHKWIADGSYDGCPKCHPKTTEKVNIVCSKCYSSITVCRCKDLRRRLKKNFVGTVLEERVFAQIKGRLNVRRRG
jgi:hypothetical protein